MVDVPAFGAEDNLKLTLAPMHAGTLCQCALAQITAMGSVN